MSALTPVPPLQADLLANLERHAEHARGAYAPATEDALRSDTAIWTAFCAERGFTPLPALPAAVAAFIDAMSETRAPATVRRYVSSIAVYHRAAGVTSPTQDVAVKLALKRMHREKGRRQKQAAGLTRPLVDRMLAACPGTTIGYRNRALLSVAYDTLARRSELVALDIADIEITDAGDGTALIRRSKTDQGGEGSMRYLAADTIAHLTVWQQVASIETGALFRSVRRGGSVGDRLRKYDVARVFKRMARAAGVAESMVADISGHSSRVGAAQDMVAAGIELPGVMQAGGWKTAAMVSRYAEHLTVRKGAAAKLASLQDRR